ncbi:MAG: glycosyltransferase, partial [Lentisphaeria bacterium]|nr:glycosyltransferase [Lentisphaeria bacterium]
MKNLTIPDGSLSVVMPVYNEEATICQIVQMVLDRPEVGELLIIDDASKDKSWE